MLTQLLTIPPEFDVYLNFYIWSLCEQISLFDALFDVPKANTIWFATHHLYYKEKLGMTESAYDLCLLYSNKLVDNSTRTFFCAAQSGLVGKKREPPKIVLNLLFHLLKPPSLLLSLKISETRPVIFKCPLMSECMAMSKWKLGSTLASFLLLADYILKIMKLLYYIPEAGKHWFAVYHPHYKDKLVGTLSTLFFFAYDGGACDTKPGLVIKKGEPPRISLHLFSDAHQLLSFMLSLTLSKMHPTMFKYLAIFKCAPMFEWPSENLPEASFNLFFTTQAAAQTVEFSSDNIALLNKWLQ